VPQPQVTAAPASAIGCTRSKSPHREHWYPYVGMLTPATPREIHCNTERDASHVERVVVAGGASISCPGDPPEDPHHRRKLRPGRRHGARVRRHKGRDLALCARRTDRLDELKAVLTGRHPDVRVAVAALDVNDHEQVPKVFGAFSDELGGIDRVIVNAGIGKARRSARASRGPTRPLSRPTWSALWCRSNQRSSCSRRLGRASGADSSVLGNKGVPGVKAAYAASKAGVSSLGESLRAEYAKGPIRVTVIEPGLHRVGNDGEVREHNADGGQRIRGPRHGRRDRARARQGHRPELAVVAAGAIAEGAAPRFTGPFA